MIWRADHVGSLLRPRDLLNARNNADTTAGQLTALEDRHILRVLARQKDAGLNIFTDGEFRRRGFMSDFYDSVEGLDKTGEIARAWKSAAASIGGRPGVGTLPGAVVQKIRQTRRLTGHELDFLKQHSPGDIKMTLPTANQFPAIAYKKGMSEKAYATRSEFLWDIMPIIKAEIAALVRKVSSTSSWTRRATAITSTRSGGITSETRWAWIPTRRLMKRSAPTTPVWKERDAMV